MGDGLCKKCKGLPHPSAQFSLIVVWPYHVTPLFHASFSQKFHFCHYFFSKTLVSICSRNLDGVQWITLSSNSAIWWLSSSNWCVFSYQAWHVSSWLTQLMYWVTATWGQRQSGQWWRWDVNNKSLMKAGHWQRSNATKILHFGSEIFKPKCWEEAENGLQARQVSLKTQTILQTCFANLVCTALILVV